MYFRYKGKIMAHTRKSVLESNDRYRKNFLLKSTRLHLIDDYDLIEALEDIKNIESFNALTIRLLRKHFKLDGGKYIDELKEGIKEKTENYRKAIVLYWNDNESYDNNVKAVNQYLKEKYQMEIGSDLQSQAILKSELRNLGILDDE